MKNLHNRALELIILRTASMKIYYFSTGRLWVDSGITIFKLEEVRTFPEHKKENQHHHQPEKGTIWPSSKQAFRSVPHPFLSAFVELLKNEFPEACVSVELLSQSLTFQIFNIFKKNTSNWAKSAGAIDSSHCFPAILVVLKTHCCHCPIN